MFAVMRIGNRQHKVTKDDRVMIEKIDIEVGQQICIEDVLMVGTEDYTAIGRPTVSNAKVYATLEELSQTAKVLYYKNKRRKGY
jgi:large subunit ribosomal protein L21